MMTICALVALWRWNCWMRWYEEDTKIVVVEKVGKREKH
jgi:hypothetical protein